MTLEKSKCPEYCGCKGKCDCHIFVGGSGKFCPECSGKEQSLSDKRINKGLTFPWYLYPEEDVKEFIKKLKERCFGYIFDSNIKTLKEAEKELYEEIDKLAGDKLT